MGKVEEANIRKSKKKKNRLLFRSIVLGILLVALAYALVASFLNGQPIVNKGDKAVDFQLQLVNGNDVDETINLSDFKGEGVMLNFWATWCGPCEDEMPYMQSLYPKYKEKGVEILAVSIDKDQFKINNFIEEHQLTFPIVHDNKEEVANVYGVIPLPTTFFINSEGEVVEKIEGALTLPKLESYLQQIQPK